MVVPISVVPSNTCTTLLASAVPVNVSVLSLVIWSVVLDPVSTVTETTTGVEEGAMVSTIHVPSGVDELTLPAISAAVMVNTWLASERALVVTE